MLLRPATAATELLRRVDPYFVPLAVAAVAVVVANNTFVALELELLAFAPSQSGLDL